MEKYAQRHARYGPITRINVNTISVSDPEVAREVLALKDLPKSQQFNLVNFRQPTVIDTVDRPLPNTHQFKWIYSLPLRFNSEAARKAKNVHDYMSQIIGEHRANMAGGRHDLLRVLMDSIDPETGETLGDADVIAHTLMFLSVGSATSSSTMSFLLIRLSENPHVLAHLQKEVDALPLDDGGLISHTHLKESRMSWASGEAGLKAAAQIASDLAPSHQASLRTSHVAYLDAVIKETMRLDAVAGAVVRIADTDLTIGGFFVPENTIIISSNTTAHIGKSWEDPETFNPERFLGDKNELGAFTPFSLFLKTP
ncbi:cytochrome P450 [Blyttiomyces helicus]|uniref:Cytochrome P450 n=1 Tax=Blyttiomyces helicus TaxID=388810 RepID=A0A4P9WA42_9FUNG|nr:cytochrome P450 [Blyttiomyces helicus]|eukprot:RKO88363.1 cytochrome P450 [Blyttiomyces helicus]